ncbi:hypothetical protein FRB94_013818 [Tulasnella sp. JGI-2019a]|nr:hypothetical protein FRB94_013818 [Tulasnella sp. JGI-2019a]KAG9010136.1 hypothetical protein FRB93_004798 [Tulasnella sp. JGI-2019a]
MYLSPLKAILCVALATGGLAVPVSKVFSLQTLALQGVYKHGVDLEDVNLTVLDNAKYAAHKEYEELLPRLDASEARARLLRSLLFNSEVDGSIRTYETSYGPEGWTPQSIDLPTQTPRMKSEIAEWLGGALPPAAIWLIQLHTYKKEDRYETIGNGYKLQSYWSTVVASFGPDSREAVVMTLLGMDLNWGQLAYFMNEARISEPTIDWVDWRLSTVASTPEERLADFHAFERGGQRRLNVVQSVLNAGLLSSPWITFTLDQVVELNKVIVLHSNPVIKPQQKEGDNLIGRPGKGPTSVLDVKARFRRLGWRFQVTLRELALYTGTDAKWEVFKSNILVRNKSYLG